MASNTNELGSWKEKGKVGTDLVHGLCMVHSGVTAPCAFLIRFTYPLRCEFTPTTSPTDTDDERRLTNSVLVHHLRRRFPVLHVASSILRAHTLVPEG